MESQAVMEKEAPSSFNQHMFDVMSNVFYGTDDGYQDGSFGEFGEFVDFYDSVDPKRRENIHYASAVGGLYGLNLLPLLKPTEITFFDINPYAVTYFELVRRVWLISSDQQNFLDRLTHEDYDAENDEEKIIRENMALKQRGALPRSRGSDKRSFAESWTYALDHFDLTKGLLRDVPLYTIVDGMESESFGEFVADKSNLWMYCSNIVEFVYLKLRFNCPANNVIASIIYPGQNDILDLAPFGCQPIEVSCEIPMKAHPVGIGTPARPTDDDRPSLEVTDLGRQFAGYCRDRCGLGENGRILDAGCGWGRLAVALADHLSPDGSYEGFDTQIAPVEWAQETVTIEYPNLRFHVADIHNAHSNPNGTLPAAAFRFPYADASFDVVCARSVFTHLAPEEIENYVAQMARVLKPGGRILAGFFLLNEESLRLSRSLAEPPDFRHAEGYVRGVFARNGIDLEPAFYGSWCGRPSDPLWQDMLIGTKT